jgi:Trk K+ transport system NAD-binding subunit
VLQLLRVLLSLLSRVRARGPGALAVGAALVIVTGVIAFQHEADVTGVSVSWHEALYWTLGLFTFEGNRFGYPRTGALRAIYFAAPLISTSALLGALLHLLEERAPLLAARFSGHTVIGGLGNLGTSLSRHFRKNRKAFIAIERLGEAPEVSNLRESGDAVVIVGDMTSIEVLRRAGCHRASEVFLTAQRDVVNLDAAFNVRRLARAEGVSRPPRVYAHVYDVALADALRHQFHARRPGDAEIVAFNIYRFAAKALVAGLVRDHVIPSLHLEGSLRLARTGWPERGAIARGDQSLAEDRRRLLQAFQVEMDRPEDPPQRYVLVGLGRFGRSVLRELLDTVPTSARFLVIERSQAAYDASVEAFSPEERARLESCVADATSALALSLTTSFSPTAVMVCTDNDLLNLRVSLQLRMRDVKTVTRMFDLDASAELGRGLEERGIYAVGLAPLFRTAIPILTYERQLLACVNLDVERSPEVDHLFYLARVTSAERARLGEACVGLQELRRAPGVKVPSGGLGLVWYGSVGLLDHNGDE